MMLTQLFQLATGSTNVAAEAAATLNADGDITAAGPLLRGYTAEEGIIITGQGSTNDVMIKMMLTLDVLMVLK